MKLSIVMACTRPQNVPRLAKFYLQEMEPHPFDLRWHIIGTRVEADDYGVAKYCEGLDCVKDGWVILVDDDTTHFTSLFKRLGEIIQSHPKAGVVVFSQNHVFGHTLHAAPENVKVGKIDMTQTIWKRDFLGDVWHNCAAYGPAVDGETACMMYRIDPSRWVFVDEVLVNKNAWPQ